ncbi:MAG TPA: 8-amino-7-oxononanoate synthase [Methylibium sp.]|uniref:8-amino-7-oxononanoate synthase n=1 Tax=Methylibium sp. TaxID=2067992 RepID=UPI002DBE637B|nr:8-amino-7-oxononanoate synthase [Methylibium sp.]HEU4458344.1 8-amino-7-oxononanoate synthase [Methylibium sp.]
MSELAAAFAAELDALEAGHARRTRRIAEPGPADAGATLRLDGQPRLAFASNDYLGLAAHPALAEAAARGARRYGSGSTASPLICGHGPSQAALEDELARFVGLPAALYFTSGYAANTGALPALAGRGDVLVCDALNHASLIDGARLSRAEVVVVPHQDVGAIEAALQNASAARRRWIAVDAVFGMDGDLAPLAALLALCERHDAWLYIDDAHGFGVLGAGGRGSVAHAGLDLAACARRLVYMATLGKAAGVAGAFVAAAAPVIDWLANRARPYFFATGAPPMLTEALRASLPLIEHDDWRRARLVELRERLARGLGALPWAAPASACAIQPLIVGSNEQVLAVMRALDAQGLWVPAIRPPTVPAGSARLRISLSALHEAADVDRLCAALHAAAQRSG